MTSSCNYSRRIALHSPYRELLGLEYHNLTVKDLFEWTPYIWPTIRVTWWRHQMETFSALLAICAGNSPSPGEFPTQKPVTRSFDIFLDLRPNKRLRKHSSGWWFDTASRPLWRHRNDSNIDSTIPADISLYYFWLMMPMLQTLTISTADRPSSCYISIHNSGTGNVCRH